ncbi:MAG: cation-translocating P-type ATPase [Rhizobiaceae bacterium]
MSCCAPGAEAAVQLSNAAAPSSDELLLGSRPVGGGLLQTDLSVPDVHCASCIGAIEHGLTRLAGVEEARVNLSTRRVSVRWRGDRMPPLVETLTGLGYPSHLFDRGDDQQDGVLAELIRAVAVSGFATGNIMLLSVSVWAGAEAATRDLFHLVSALIAIPALMFAGRIFYRSAWSALRVGRMNMDVPIALGVSLAYAMSLYETINHGPHAYFDAAVSLLFFLLIGRTLDHVMREKARTAVRGLAALVPRGAWVRRNDGGREYVPVAEIRPGMRLSIAAGERVPVDARVVEGSSTLDCSVVSGESAPQATAPNGNVRSGTLNLTAPLLVEATATVDDSFLSDMVRLMEAAEGGRARYRRIADRVSRLYAPVVHLTALLTMVGWVVATGDWHRAITIAIAVLIITCPCALGLAVPIVQVVAARRLFEKGVMVKDGSAMERLAEIDTALFDKTGTLTLGRPRLVHDVAATGRAAAMAGSLASQSRHPLSLAIATRFAPGPDEFRFEQVEEHAGLGIEGRLAGRLYRLGRGEWAGGGSLERTGAVFSEDGRVLATFDVEDIPRPGARAALHALRQACIATEIVSGDSLAAVTATASALGVQVYRGAMLPTAKLARIDELTAEGRLVLMVGDGLNDAPALAAAHVSMAPATAADIGRNAADFVFLGESLDAVPFALDISRGAGRLIRQNLSLAIAYNTVAVPIAMFGYVTPLIAAIAMSLSSVVVIANALRLRARGATGTGEGAPLVQANPAR